MLERAVALDPTYAQAQANLAWWLNFRIGEGWSPDVAADSARAIAVSRRAVELDNEDAFVLAVAAQILSFIGKKPGEAIELFEQALALNQNSAFAWGLSALTLAYLGRPDEAMERLQNVRRLNPFDPLNFYFCIIAGIAQFVAVRYSEAVSWLRKCRRKSAVCRLSAHAGGFACPVRGRGGSAIGWAGASLFRAFIHGVEICRVVPAAKIRRSGSVGGRVTNDGPA